MRRNWLDLPRRAAGGLTIRELHADLESLHVAFDPAWGPARLYAERQAARARKGA